MSHTESCVLIFHWAFRYAARFGSITLYHRFVSLLQRNEFPFNFARSHVHARRGGILRPIRDIYVTSHGKVNPQRSGLLGDSTTLICFYKNHVYKNIQAQIDKKIRTS